MSETIITSRSTRIMISFDYCNFEFSSTLTCDAGVSAASINDEATVCQSLAISAIEQYKTAKDEHIRSIQESEKLRVEQTINDLKGEISSSIGVKDNANLNEVLSKPLYVAPEKTAQKLLVKKVK